MTFRLSSIAVVLGIAGCASAPEVAKPPPPAAPAAPASTVSVTRYTDRPLSEFQTMVMNEATKLSYACRMFRSLYGRWPRDLAEIEARTEGINFGVFLGKATVTPLPDDSAKIEIFDGVNTRAVKAVPVDFQITDEQRAAAQKPDFKIRV